MSMITEFTNKINSLFDERGIEEIAKQEKLIVRKRKITGFKILQSFMILSLQNKPSLEGLTSILSDFKIAISRQALHKKTGTAGLEFCKVFLNKILSLAMPKCKGLHSIKEIVVVDSSSVGKVSKKIDGQKLQMVADILGKSVKSLELTAYNKNDQSYTGYIKYAGKDKLMIGDLGYFCIKSFKAINDKSGLFLFRYFRRVRLRSIKDEQLDLEQLLLSSKEEIVDTEVILSSKGFKCRLIAIKLTEEQQILRDEHIKRKKRRDQRLRLEVSELDKWNIFVTNLSTEFSPTACYELYASRWQIEIIFKALKSSGLMIDQVNAKAMGLVRY